jgi:hypothetical protein
MQLDPKILGLIGTCLTTVVRCSRGVTVILGEEEGGAGFLFRIYVVGCQRSNQVGGNIVANQPHEPVPASAARAKYPTL